MPYLLVRHRVENYETWKPVFDEHGATRGENGSKGGYLSAPPRVQTKSGSSLGGRILRRPVGLPNRRIYEKRCSGLELLIGPTSTSWRSSKKSLCEWPRW